MIPSIAVPAGVVPLRYTTKLPSTPPMTQPVQGALADFEAIESICNKTRPSNFMPPGKPRLDSSCGGKKTIRASGRSCAT